MGEAAPVLDRPQDLVVPEPDKFHAVLSSLTDDARRGTANREPQAGQRHIDMILESLRVHEGSLLEVSGVYPSREFQQECLGIS